jgi:RsiW-degrading membrane proteinase PrsW (M82 family)
MPGPQPAGQQPPNPYFMGAQPMGHQPPAGYLPVPQFPGEPGAVGTAYRPQISRTVASVGAPTGAMIAAGAATALGLGYNFTQNFALALLGVILAGTAGAIVVFTYLWLDRWEPEPPRLLLLAWLWGGIAVVFSLLTSLFDTNQFFSAVIRAPIVEELAKGAFLLFMATGVRKRELNTLVDCLVYAGLVAGSFGFIENVLYMARGETLGGAFVLAAIRLPTPFLHPLFTSVTAVGLYYGLKKGTKNSTYGYLALGYAGAVVLHMIWNGLPVNIFVHVLLFLPVFAGAVALAVISRRREQRVLLSQIPGIVASGLISPAEGAWLSTLQGRKGWRSFAAQQGGPGAKALVANLAGAVTELAFVRDKVDRGFGSADTAQRYNELAAVISDHPHPRVPPSPPPTATPPPPAPTGLQASPQWGPIPGPARQ